MGLKAGEMERVRRFADFGGLGAYVLGGKVGFGPDEKWEKWLILAVFCVFLAVFRCVLLNA